MQPVVWRGTLTWTPCVPCEWSKGSVWPAFKVPWANYGPWEAMKLTVKEFRVMYTYIMQRTQISLTAEERRALDTESARTGKSLSALIREAVEAMYGTMRSSSDDLDLMRQSFGSWSDHNEDGASFVDKLRSGSRLTRHG